MKALGKLAATAVLGTLAIAAEAEAKELRLATISPDNSIWHKQTAKFVEKISELSGGELTISYFGNAQMGTMEETIKMTLTGRLDMWLGATPVLGSVVPEISLLSLPYVFDSAGQVACVVPQLVEPTRTVIDDKFRLVGFSVVGSQSIGSKEPVHVPADLDNVKLRTAPLKPTMVFFGAIGANPVPLPAPETTAALSTGLVDAVDLAPIYYMATGTNKIVTNFTPTEHTYNLGGLTISSRTWNSLSDAEKKIIDDAWAQTMDFPTIVKEVASLETEMLEAHKKSGGTVIELTEAERGEWIAAGRASWEQIIPETRGDAEGYLATIEAAKLSCEK